MKSKKHIFLVIGIVVVFVLTAFTIVYFCRIKLIEHQFNKIYGESFKNEGKSVKGNQFEAMTDDGILIRGTCDVIGNIKTESYVNYFYSDECSQYIMEEIGSCFDDCVVVTETFDNLSLSLYDFNVNSIQSFDDYISAVKSLNRNFYSLDFRVYIRQTEDLEHINAAKSILDSKEDYFNVDFYVIPDDIYDAHKESGIYCYCQGDYMEEFFKSLGENNYDRFLKLVFEHQGRID